MAFVRVTEVPEKVRVVEPAYKEFHVELSEEEFHVITAVLGSTNAFDGKGRIVQSLYDSFIDKIGGYSQLKYRVSNTIVTEKK